jgi:hypothetical protein
VAKLTDEQRRALGILARYPDGCAEAILLTDGFHVGQLAVLVMDGFATMRQRRADVGGRERTAVWMEITEAGRKAIAE